MIRCAWVALLGDVVSAGASLVPLAQHFTLGTEYGVVYGAEENDENKDAKTFLCVTEWSVLNDVVRWLDDHSRARRCAPQVSSR